MSSVLGKRPGEGNPCWPGLSPDAGVRSMAGPSLAKKATCSTDVLLAKEMNALTFDERERVYEDVHGVAHIVEETPELIERSINELNEALSRIHSNKKEAFDQANFLSPEHVDSLKLTFLRAQGFQAKPAASKMVDYFTYKRELFGLGKLVKNIHFDDLSPRDQEALLSGSIQCSKDHMGRLLLLCFEKYQKYHHWTNQMRMFWYLVISATLEDEEVQKKGVVAVVYNLGPFRMEDIDVLLYKNSPKFGFCLPIRFVGFHYCFNDARLAPAINLAKLTGGTNAMLRYRVHFGTHLECQYALLTYGIYRHTITVDNDGNLSMETFLNQIEARKTAEREQEAAKETRIIECPNEFDVLLGRGRPYQTFPGNLKWAAIVDEMQERYASAGLGEKQFISEDALQEVRTSGGRYLKREKTGWIEVSDNVARDKNSQRFRRNQRNKGQNDALPTSHADDGDMSL